ncbi:uncharacterized protein LOC118410148 isoform X3 [Branchiostoma floridae]|uniref:Uncharacterized protein LOC118410148 isoform X3 n=1 Tax=Branchiostoma floridae TaxID=7739 RepID=A0A9J7KP71_BRAFL|nr:uncharacterized protein LOC118410148 isoform X3 [Branchiostoma floridae]
MPTVTASRQHPGIRRCREISGVIYETTVAFYTRGEAANSSPSLFISNRSVSEARAAKGEAKAHRSAGATRHIPEDVGRISGFIFEEIRGVQTADGCLELKSRQRWHPKQLAKNTLNSSRCK